MRVENASRYLEPIYAEFLKRKRRNQRYSLRTFSEDVGVSASMLSLVFRGKKKFSIETALAVCERLNFRPQTREEVIRHLRSLQNSSTTSVDRLAHSSPDDSELEINVRAFQALSQWHHSAVCEALELKGLKGNINKISAKLELPPSVVRSALENLRALGLVKKRNGVWTRSTPAKIKVPDEASAAIREFHKGMLNQAWTSLERTPQKQRDISGITMASSPDKLKEAKLRIAEFREELRQILKSENPTCVYHLAVQLFPLHRS